MIVSVTINGQKKKLQIKPNEILLDVLRREGYFGVKRGCSEGDCGACIVLIGNIPRKTCIMFAAQIRGQKLTTIEGLAPFDKPHPIQKAFVEEAGVQCGYCIPGMILSAEGLLRDNPNPSEQEIKIGLAGNLCRCTGYVKQIKAVQKAAAEIREGSK